jgi:hypothetical protein
MNPLLSQAKSLYRSRAGSHLYGTEYEIWAGFGLFGNTEKTIWADYEPLLGGDFSMFSWAKKKLFF